MYYFIINKILHVRFYCFPEKKLDQRFNGTIWIRTYAINEDKIYKKI